MVHLVQLGSLRESLRPKASLLTGTAKLQLPASTGTVPFSTFSNTARHEYTAPPFQPEAPACLGTFTGASGLKGTIASKRTWVRTYTNPNSGWGKRNVAKTMAAFAENSRL